MKISQSPKGEVVLIGDGSDEWCSMDARYLSYFMHWVPVYDTMSLEEDKGYSQKFQPRNQIKSEARPKKRWDLERKESLS